MTPPVRPEQGDEFARWKAEREFREWQAARRKPVPTPDEIAARNAADFVEARKPDDFAGKMAGFLSVLSKDIPGAEAAQAFAASKANDIPYAEALEMIRGAHASVPTAARIGGRVAGGLLGAMAAPGSTALRQGAVWGAAEGLGRADEMGAKERAARTVGGGLLGAAGGKIAEQIGTGVRALRALPAGKAALTRRGAIADADEALYGRADIEGLLTPTTPRLTAALDSRGVQPFAERVRQSETMLGASEADVAKETFKTMSEVQGKMLRQQEGSPDFLANLRMQTGEIKLAKARLLKGMESAMPTYPKAVATHAEGMGELGSFKRGLDAARRAISSKDVGGRKIEMESPESFVGSVEKMTPAEARAAIEGVLGAVRRAPKLTSNVLSGFGVFSSAARTPLALMRVQPLLHALDRKAGAGTAARLFERAGITATLPASGLLAGRE